MRMFVAVVPPAEVIEHVGEFLEPRRDADPDLRWTQSYQWHLTLAFLPEVGPRTLDDLVERLTTAAAKRSAFPVTLTGSGAFSSPERARVLWLGVAAEPPEALTLLATRTRAAANQAGAVVEGGRFRAHLTLARQRVPRDATKWLRILGSYEGSPWLASEIELIESHLGDGPEAIPVTRELPRCLSAGLTKVLHRD